jgi:hypothetical protein
MPKYDIKKLNEEYKQKIAQSQASQEQPTPSTPSDKPKSPLQSAMIGASRGATFGLADEAIARLESIRSGRPYEDVLQEARGMYKSASEQNPASYLTGEIGAGIAAPIGQAATGAKLGRLAIAGAGTGVLSGLGYSEGETAGEVARDVAIGGALGGALPVLGRGIAKGVQSLKPIADEAVKTSLTGFTGKTRAFLDQIEKNPTQVKRIEEKFAGDIQQEILPEINAKINDFMTKNPYKDRAVQGSQKAINAIPDDTFISRDTGTNVINNYLKELEKDTVSQTAEDARVILNTYLKRFENTKEQIPGREIKKTLQNLDSDIEKKFGGYGNPFANDEASKAIKGLRFAWDNELKTKVPDYEKIMKKVRRDASASESLTNRFATKEGVNSGKISAFTDRLLKQQEKIMSTPEIKTDIKRIEAISRLPQSEIGLQTIGQDIKDIGLKKAIESRGNQGTNVMLTPAIGGGFAGSALGNIIAGTPGGFAGGALGTFLGGIAGRQLEQRGGKISESVLRGTKGIRTPTPIPEATQRGFQAQQGLQRGLLDQFLTENAGEVRRKREVENNFNNIKNRATK